MSPRPFQRGSFASLPERPRRSHPFFELERKQLELDSAPFGRVGVRYRELGSGPPLLLVHGLMTTGYSFRYVVEPLSRRYRVLVPDLVGAGESDKPDGAYDAPALATFIGELIGALGIRGCRVLGNSLGGYLCMWLALRDPSAMSRLVNLHSPGVPLARLFALRGAMALPGADRLLGALVSRDPERWAHRNVHYFDESLKSREEAREYAAPLSTPDGRRAFAAYLRDTLDPRDMRRFVARLRRERFPVPLLLLYARRDPMVPPSVGTALADLVPSAELTWLDGVSHFAHVDGPEIVLGAMERFLEAS
jgi:pimeloyl-ACP methyl ester carboxylesterase